MSDRDRQQWQAEQQALDAALERQRDKERKARERAARNAQRKIDRLRRTLGEAGELSEWEAEFSGSVSERLDKYGSAFHDLEKGRPGDALSFAQKRVVAALNKKAKDQRKAARLARLGDPDAKAAPDMNNADERSHERPKKPRFKSGFKTKAKARYKARVRQIDEDFDDEAPPAPRQRMTQAEPFIPDFADRPPAKTPPVKKPFLRIVKSNP